MPEKSKRGFASMDRARQREIAAKGGRAAHAKGTAHVWSVEEAREAGRKGGEVISQDRSHMSLIGREGGESRSASVRAARIRHMKESAAKRAGARAVAMEREVEIDTSRDGMHVQDGSSTRAAGSVSLDHVRPSLEQRDMA